MARTGHKERSGGLPKVGGWALALLSCVAALGVSRPARACSGGTSGIFARRIFPGAGSTGVPLNARVVVTYTTSPRLELPSRAVQIRPVGGEPIPLDVEPSDDPLTVVVRPRTALNPYQSYEVLDPLLVPCQALECRAAEPSVVSTFVTSGAPDLVPPTFAGVARVESTPYPYTSCFYDTAFWLTLGWNAARDESSSAVLYHVYDITATTPLASFVTGPELTTGVTCPKWPRGPLSVRAFDWAGNLDMNQAFIMVPPSCSGNAADGSVPVDSSTGADGGTGDAGPPDASVAGDADAQPSDASETVDVSPLDGPVPDAGAAGDVASADAAPPREEAGPPVRTHTSAGCGCTLSGHSRESSTLAGAAASLALALSLAAARRAKRRQTTP